MCVCFDVRDIKIGVDWLTSFWPAVHQIAACLNVGDDTKEGSTCQPHVGWSSAVVLHGFYVRDKSQ